MAGDWREGSWNVDAHNGSELAALAAKVEELSRVCARLSQENAQLHGIGLIAVCPGSLLTPPRQL